MESNHPTNNNGKAVRVAMWSGPRNISTAMMRAWGNRPDTFVCDEPLYAHYLYVTGKPHPLAAEVIASQPTDWHQVVKWLTGEIPERKTVFFQKHMAHHLLPNIDRQWLGLVINCFLIRHPAEVITSYLAKRVTPTLDDLGFVQQREIFEMVRASCGTAPPVLDAKDVQQNPRHLLEKLCQLVEVPFYESMLAWPPGLRSTDGVWAKHWYPEVGNSTSFRPYQPKPTAVPPALQRVYAQSLECYEILYEYRLQ
jgi:hypothetical protein